MDFNTIIQMISSVGFPIVMCIVVCFYVKTLIETNAEQIDKITERHRQESAEMTTAINNNTAALTRLIDKLED